MEKIKRFKNLLKENPIYFVLIKKLKNYYKKRYLIYKNKDLDKAYLYLAAIESLKAFLKGEVPIGAVLVSPEKKIFKAHNLKENLNDPSAHAEILAIRKAAKYYRMWFLKDFKLFVTLEPCLMCFGCILEARISKLVFSCHEPKYGFSNYISNFNKKGIYKNITIKNLNLSDITIPIKIFFQLLRKVK